MQGDLLVGSTVWFRHISSYASYVHHNPTTERHSGGPSPQPWYNQIPVSNEQICCSVADTAANYVSSHVAIQLACARSLLVKKCLDFLAQSSAFGIALALALATLLAVEELTGLHEGAFEVSCNSGIFHHIELDVITELGHQGLLKAVSLTAIASSSTVPAERRIRVENKSGECKDENDGQKNVIPLLLLHRGFVADLAGI